MGLFEPQHLLIVLAIALIIFGPGKIGDLGGSLGRGIRDFKKAMAEPASQPAQASAQEAQPTALQQTAPEHAVNVTATAHKETA
jgi:sec-independent protein translocase protein TatA